MDDIIEPSSTYNFNKLVLNKPVLSSGNYFIKFSAEAKPLYIQPPKCVIKQLILNKSSKKSHCDLIFSQENEEFIQWVETLESYSQKKIFENRKLWFETELEMDDIENSFTSPMKSYKSGTQNIIRTNMTPRLGKINIKIYDESEKDIPVEDISGNMNVITILEIQGIKCSAKNFQIDIELKQMMVLNAVDLFEKCVFKINKKENTENSKHDISQTNEIHNTYLEESISRINNDIIDEDEAGDGDGDQVHEEDEPRESINEVDTTNLGKDQDLPEIKQSDLNTETIHIEPPVYENNELTEIDFDLAEIPDSEIVQIKARDDVYYKIYREAKQKAKIAKNLALSAYLEAQEIKNKYMLDDSDSDNSDLDEEDGE
jgi:hypothetical protein